MTPLSRVELVRVGSRNPPKLEAVRAAVGAYASGVRVEGVLVATGVSEQPVGWDEIVVGARNRARGALAGGACDLAVGIEDGLVEMTFEDRREVLNVGCAFITDGVRESVGFSSAFAYPPQCVAPALDERAPIGDVFDRVFSAYARETGEPPSGTTTGNIGKLSRGVLPRSDYARQAVLCALVRFLHPELYDAEPAS
ncbi:MAG: inosine/xanthosine triphosphatase [Myxococcota bacterium]